MDHPVNGDSWIIATEYDEGGYGFGILHEAENTMLKSYLGPNLGPKLAGIASLLTCCLHAKHVVGLTTSMVIHLDQMSAIKAVTVKKVDSKLAAECIEILNELAETREVTLIWASAITLPTNAGRNKEQPYGSETCSFHLRQSYQTSISGQ